MQVRYQDKKFNKDNSWDVKVKANCNILCMSEDYTF